MSARNPFAKFSLKPSSLSQHTVNFNKILEEVPSPKINSIILEKPKLGVALDVKPETGNTDKTVKEKESSEKKEESEKAQSAVSAPTFVFGEQLTDRVINADEVKSNGQSTNGTSKNEKNLVHEIKSTSLFGNQDAETEKYNVDHLNDDASTIIRMNVKLFVLEKDSKDEANWSERGYGTLKMIESKDEYNCKIMMWTDKCFRLVLNTKLFKSMDIEKVNRKSIRFNAQDDGTLKIFLIKCGHPNECEELAAKMIYRLKIYKEKSVELGDSKTECQPDSNHIDYVKEVVLECDCEVESSSKSNEPSIKLPAKIQVYKNSTVKSDQISTNQFLLDLLSVDSELKILSNRNLKSIILEKDQNLTKKVDSPLFEIKESFHLSHKVTLKSLETIENFLKFYEQEKKSTELDASSSESNNETSSDEESDSAKKSNASRSLESSLTNKSDLENSESQANTEKSDYVSKEIQETNNSTKKRKNETDELEDKNVKKISVNESYTQKDETSTTSLKRAACNSSQESSQGLDEQSIKKTKVNEDDIF